MDMESSSQDNLFDVNSVLNGLRTAQKMVHHTSQRAGWYNDPATGAQIKRNFGEVVALMHSELSEALEADRKNLMDEKLPNRSGVEVEFADCIIRILDTAEALGLDIAGALVEKNHYNMHREDHKLENRAKNNGKKY
jgi:NTP pyrophosphatase (non-canonical NTP hydrolase)